MDNMEFDDLKWTREPADLSVEPGRIEITTAPHTDLWQRTYYHFRNDNAPVLQKETDEKYFSFTVKTDFSGSSHRFNQCGIVMYLDCQRPTNEFAGLHLPGGTNGSRLPPLVEQHITVVFCMFPSFT